MKTIDSKDGVIHHVHHQAEDSDQYRREITISGATHNISLSSSYPKEDIEFLCAKALDLLKRRDPSPPVFGSAADVAEMPSGVVARRELVLKHSCVEDLMRRTRSDEG